jgi:hypothetical protein
MLVCTYSIDFIDIVFKSIRNHSIINNNINKTLIIKYNFPSFLKIKNKIAEYIKFSLESSHSCNY